jgi:hypothetical protein
MLPSVPRRIFVSMSFETFHRWRGVLRGAVMGVLATACAPPSPDAATVHDARTLTGTSSVSFVTDTACTGRRIRNTRFERVRLAQHDPVIVEQADDVTTRDCREGSEGTVTVRVWPDSFAASTVSTFTASGAEGATFVSDALFAARTFAPLHRITTFGCCGASDQHTWFHLLTGRPVFASNAPLATFIANGTVRYVAVLVSGPLAPVDSAQWPMGTGAVVQYGSGNDAPRTVRVPGDSGVSYWLTELRVEGPHRADDSTMVTVGRLEGDTVAVSGVAIRFLLVPQGDGDLLDVTAEVRNDALLLRTVQRRRQPPASTPVKR